jgi:glycosyltransferase involved in cell wall biosynthesis
MATKRKIILAAEIFPPDIGGPAGYASQLATELVTSGFAVRVLTYGEVRQKFNFPVFYVSRQIPFGLRQLIYGFKLLVIGWSADLVYAQGPSVGPAAWLLKIFRHTPVVIKYVGEQSWQQLRVKGSHIGFAEYMLDYGKFWDLKIWWIQKWQKIALLHTNQVVTPSLYLKNVLAKYLSVPEQKIQVIANGVNIANTKSDTKIDRTVLFVGRLENWKGLDTLLSAMAELSDWQLVVVGDGHERTVYEQLARKLNVASRVRFTGAVGREKVEHNIQAAYCLVLDSEYEGMPHTVLEAWAQGLPVIVSDFPANTELVEHLVTGLVIKQGQVADLVKAIQLLFSDKKLYTKIVHNSLLRVKQYKQGLIFEKTVSNLRTFMN